MFALSCWKCLFTDLVLLLFLITKLISGLKKLKGKEHDEKHLWVICSVVVNRNLPLWSLPLCSAKPDTICSSGGKDTCFLSVRLFFCLFFCFSPPSSLCSTFSLSLQWVIPCFNLTKKGTNGVSTTSVVSWRSHSKVYETNPPLSGWSNVCDRFKHQTSSREVQLSPWRHRNDILFMSFCPLF